MNAVQGCFHCHGRVVQTSVDNTTAGNAGAVGTLCLGRCHALTGIYATEPGSLQPQEPAYPTDNSGTFAWVAPGANYQAVLFSGTTHSHGRDKTLAGTNRSGAFPYDGAGSTGSIECTSCHAVHDDANSPFIWRQMNTVLANWPPTASATTTGLCDTCHINKADLGGPAATWTATRSALGNHPVDIIVDTAAAQTRSGGYTTVFKTERHGRAIKFNYAAYGNHNAFDVTSSAGAALRTLKGTAAWTTGGKVVNGPNNFGALSSGTSILGCYTCHSAHKTGAGATNNLVNVLYEDVASGYNPLCVGCHGNTDTWLGDKTEYIIGASSFGHPVGDCTAYTTSPNIYTVSTGAFTFAVNQTTNPLSQWGTNGRVMCSTCHLVHNQIGTSTAIANSMAIRNLGQVANVVCKQCHNGIGLPNVNGASKGGTGEGVRAHHRTSTSVTAGAQGSPVADTTRGNGGEAESPAIAMQLPSWQNIYTGLGLGAGSGSRMDCADCHVFNGTAHNW